MRYSRIIGQNILLAMNENNISMSYMLENLDYTEKDMYRIIEGVTLIDSQELDNIADVLGVDVDELSTPRDEAQYREIMHCMGEYHNSSNKDKILDYIDLYIKLAEVVG